MLRLVIADDEKSTRDCVIECIDWEQHGMQIVGTASDGLEAKRLIEQERPDIAILDIQMPSISGLDVMEALQGSVRDTAYIIISSFDTFSYVKQAMHLGAVEYLLKPFLPENLLAAIYKASRRIGYLRWLQTEPAAPEIPSAPVWNISFDNAHIKSSADIAYPFREERALLDALQLGSREVLDARIADFSQAAAQNETKEKQENCFLILYVELYRFAALHNIDTLSQPLPESSIPRLGQIESFVFDTCRLIFEACSAQESASALVKMAMHYIRAHYAENLTLETVARHIYISPSYLSSLFRQNIGKSFIEYLNYVRIEKAKELLFTQPHLKNSEIAAQLGYSPKYFAQIFKQLEGVTLSEYRLRR